MPALAKFNPEFETFGDPQLSRMLNASSAFAESIRNGEPPRWLSLLGASGAGKTFLARQLFRWFKASPLFKAVVDVGEDHIIHPGGFYSWRKTADMILGGDYSRVSDMCDERLVVIDDIGAEYKDKAGIVKSKLDRILDARVGKWTVLTCNYSLEQIGHEMDTRISSRMLRNQSVVVDVDVIDFNLRRRAA
jgi:DNA replication protein DnaC